jgi:acetylglutamate kinase
VTLADARSAPRDTAAILVEALPYIRRFHGAVVVVKFGGAALGGAEDPAAVLAAFAEDVALLRSVGLAPVVVHGGGPQIAAMLGRLGRTSEFVDGHRVTDHETLEIARMVLVGQVNSELVAAINVHGPLAVGVSGFDANLLRVGLRDAELGFVGDVDAVDPTLLHGLLAQGLVPVVATMGSDLGGQAYNVNADAVAGALAVALGAEKLVILTDVAGLRRDPGDPATTLARLTDDELSELLEDGIAAGGMAPKAEACLAAVRCGVRAAHLLDGRVAHALLLELFTDRGVGTMVEPAARQGAAERAEDLTDTDDAEAPR